MPMLAARVVAVLALAVPALFSAAICEAQKLYCALQAASGVLASQLFVHCSLS